MAAMGSQLLNFSVPFDVSLLDNTVAAFYGTVPAEVITGFRAGREALLYHYMIRPSDNHKLTMSLYNILLL